MNINITLAEALDRASEGLRKKMLHSVELIQKAEKIALNDDALKIINQTPKLKE